MPNWLGAIDIGPLCSERIAERDPRLAERAVERGVERLRPRHLEDGADLQVVLQVLADAAALVADTRCRAPLRTSGLPMPESSRSFGELIAPAASSTSASARTS